MSDGFIALMFGIGFAGWVYVQVNRRAGSGNEKTAVIAAGIGFVIGFLFLFTITRYVFHI